MTLLNCYGRKRPAKATIACGKVRLNHMPMVKYMIQSAVLDGCGMQELVKQQCFQMALYAMLITEVRENEELGPLHDCVAQALLEHSAPPAS